MAESGVACSQLSWCDLEPSVITTEALDRDEVQGVLALPINPNGLGVLILTGSSGRVDTELAETFARLEASALALRWWGGRGQPPGINEVPLEIIVRGVDELQAHGCTRIAVHGTSFGALAALLTAVRDERIDIVIAVSPASVVWQNIGPGLDRSEWPPRSAFSWRGSPLPCVMFDPRKWPPAGTVSQRYRGLYEASLETFAEDAQAAAIPIELSRAEYIFVAGGDDALWPSDAAAHALAARLRNGGRGATVIEHPGAGHSPVYPGEAPRPAPAERAWGGSPEADSALGAVAWGAIIEHLGLT